MLLLLLLRRLLLLLLLLLLLYLQARQPLWQMPLQPLLPLSTLPKLLPVLLLTWQMMLTWQLVVTVLYLLHAVTPRQPWKLRSYPPWLHAERPRSRRHSFDHRLR